MDWNKIRLEYVTTEVSYRELCDKYKISFSTLSKIAVKEKWGKERQRHRKKVVKKAQQKIETRRVKQLAREMEICENISETLLHAVKCPEQFVLLRDEEGEVSKYSMAEIISSLEALSKLEKSKRSLYGIETEREKKAMELAREKLAAITSARGTAPDTSECGVVLLPSIEDMPANSSESGA